MTQPLPFCIKIVDDKRIGFLKVKNAKFYLGEDGILSIVPIYKRESDFCGVFKDGALTEIPSKYSKAISSVLEKLTYMNSVLSQR